MPARPRKYEKHSSLVVGDRMLLDAYIWWLDDEVHRHRYVYPKNAQRADFQKRRGHWMVGRCRELDTRHAARMHDI